MNDRTIMMRIDLVALETRKEEDRQDQKWGQQDHPDGTGPTDGNLSDRNRAKWVTQREFAKRRGTWRQVLEEEVAEAFAESDPDLLKAELIQVAAVAQQWIRAINRRQEEQQ